MQCYYTQYYTKCVWINDGILYIDHSFADFLLDNKEKNGYVSLGEFERVLHERLHELTGINRLVFKWDEDIKLYVGV